MANIDVPYVRQFTDSDLAEFVARGATTVNVMQQLGAPYQSLPGFEMAAYEAEVNSLEADVATLNGLVNQISTLLAGMDAKAGPLKKKNEGALAALRGLLKGKAQEDLLDQITGPQPAGGGAPPPPPPNP